jgi:spermidine synthase
MLLIISLLPTIKEVFPLTDHWKWFIEYTDPSQAHMYGVDKYIYSGRTAYQTVEIIDTPFFGRCLILDGKIQSAEFDEYIYHETLTHPAMVLSPSPKKILVLGGGEGAMLREILRYPSVEKVVMVDIDREVVELCQKYLPSWSNGSFSDQRVELLHVDARHYVEDTDERFDLIFSDLTEPVEDGPSYLLFTREFYCMLTEKLSANGIVALQAGSFNPRLLDVHSALYHTLRTSFKIVRSFHVFIPSFDTDWGFLFASQQIDPQSVSPAEIDRKLELINSVELKFYDGETHRGIFSIPKNIRRLRDSNQRIIEDNNPLFVY